MNSQLPTCQILQNAALSQFYQTLNSPTMILNQFSPSLEAYKAMLLNAKASKMMQLKAFYLQNMHNNLEIKQEIGLKVESPASTTEPSGLPQASSYTQSLSPQSFQTEAPKSMTDTLSGFLPPCEQANYDTFLKVELEKMIKHLLTHMGKNQQSEVENGRNKYLNNSCLLQIYDKLVMKYYSAKKCKEDIVRYILRKAFKTIKTNLTKEEKVNGKKASQLLCKRYFQSNFEKLEKAGVSLEKEEDFIEFFMPYHKKSKNRTMNTTFVLEVFSSEEFCKVYQQFLDEFDSALVDDNNKKIKKLINLLIECIKKNDLSKLGGFNRLPWLDVWMEDTKSIAVGLMTNKELPYNLKKSKY